MDHIMSSSIRQPEMPRWASWWLGAAGIYNLAWGSLTIAFPHLLFDFAGHGANPARLGPDRT